MAAEKKSLAPIILMTYARPEHTQKTLDALAGNLLAKESDLYIFCDGPKNARAVEKNQQVQEIIQREATAGRFANVHVTVSQENRGLARSIISGATQIIDTFGRCILLEDDLVTSPCFLTYMNDCLDFYESDPRIWSISGFSFPLKALKKYPYDVYLSYRASSHGWATWKDRWDTIDWEVKDFPELERSFAKRRHFNRGGNDLFRMLRHQMRGERDSWAIRFCYAQSKQNRYAVYPSVSLVHNIGFDGSGTHCADDKRLQAMAWNADATLLTPAHVEPDRAILREFKDQYRIRFGEAVQWMVKKVCKK